MRRPHSYTRPTLAGAQILGAEIAAARRRRGWSAQELAERIGVAPGTLRKVERGDPTVAVGIVFEAATLLGLPLFGVDRDERLFLAERQAERLELLPARVRRPVSDDDGDF